MSPIEVVRRNREKRQMEKELASLNNDVWNLSVDDEAEKAAKDAQSSGALSDIFKVEKHRYEDQQRRQRRQRMAEYEEAQFGLRAETHCGEMNFCLV